MFPALVQNFSISTFEIINLAYIVIYASRKFQIARIYVTAGEADFANAYVQVRKNFIVDPNKKQLAELTELQFKLL